MRAGALIKVLGVVIGAVVACSTVGLARADDLDPVAQIVGSGITNFHIIAPGKIYRGALPEKSGINLLSQAGIKTIIDLQGGDRFLGIPLSDGESKEDIQDERKNAMAFQIGFISEPLLSMSLDSEVSPASESQDNEIDRIVSEMADPSNQPVFVHCRHGSDRTGLVSALYRVFYEDCTPDQAHQEMLAYGHSQLPLFTWMDHYFYAKVKDDPRTHWDISPQCPLTPQ